MHVENYEIDYWAKIYDTFNVSRMNKEERAFYLEQSKKAKGKVLELGCGTGAIIIPIHMKIRWIYKEECFLLLKNASFKNINVYGDFKFLKAKYESELVWVATN